MDPVAERIPAAEELLRVEGLKKHFPIRKGLLSRVAGHVFAVDGVSFAIKAGETLGLVGESGCGKTTVGRLIVRLYQPTAGRIFLNGEDISHLRSAELLRFRTQVQMIFQDPLASLNPRLRVYEIIGEALKVHQGLAEVERKDRVCELLRQVGLQPDHLARYPHEFSGGQRQRIGIARALALSPRLIIADEPVSALDVSIQAQVINLLDSLKESYGLSYLVVAHDLSCGGAHLRPHCRDVPGQAGGTGLGPGPLPEPPASLYPGASSRGTPRRGRRAQEARADPQGRHPQPHQPAARLPLSHSLS